MCNCQQFDVEVELSLEFWGPWIAKTRVRAKALDEIVDSYTKKLPKTSWGTNARKLTKTDENQRKRTKTNGFLRKWGLRGRGRGGGPVDGVGLTAR